MGKYLFTGTLFVIFVYYLLSGNAFACGSNDDYCSTKHKVTNMRIGPDRRFKIKYIYHGKNITLKIIREFEGWLQVQDIYGDYGWINKKLLRSKPKYVFIVSPGITQGFTSINADNINVHIEQYAVMKVEECKKDMCLLLYNKQYTWVKKEDLWGI